MEVPARCLAVAVEKQSPWGDALVARAAMDLPECATTPP